ncbi:MAG: site-specific DNA-methyltransferase, partial [Anaerolineales bacterium]|nr:site-specific DNA-methyltransferase [Anaerolineales bacterium]
MTEYKSIHFTVDFEAGSAILNIANDNLASQPEPRPYIKPNLAGYVFYFHTLDIKLLKKNIEV